MQRVFFVQYFLIHFFLRILVQTQIQTIYKLRINLLEKSSQARLNVINSQILTLTKHLINFIHFIKILFIKITQLLFK